MKILSPAVAALLLTIWTGSIAADVTGGYFAIVVEDIDASEAWYR